MEKFKTFEERIGILDKLSVSYVLIHKLHTLYTTSSTTFDTGGFKAPIYYKWVKESMRYIARVNSNGIIEALSKEYGHIMTKYERFTIGDSKITKTQSGSLVLNPPPPEGLEKYVISDNINDYRNDYLVEKTRSTWEKLNFISILPTTQMEITWGDMMKSVKKILRSLLLSLVDEAWEGILDDNAELQSDKIRMFRVELVACGLASRVLAKHYGSMGKPPSRYIEHMDPNVIEWTNKWLKRLTLIKDKYSIYNVKDEVIENMFIFLYMSQDSTSFDNYNGDPHISLQLIPIQEGIETSQEDDIEYMKKRLLRIVEDDLLTISLYYKRVTDHQMFVHIHDSFNAMTYALYEIGDINRIY